MNVLLRSLTANAYVSRRGKWVATRSQARNFREVQKALNYAAEKRLPESEVILATAHGDFVVPVRC